MIGNMKYQLIGTCRTTRYKGFESFNNKRKFFELKKKLSYQKRHDDFSNQSISYTVVVMEKAR